MKKNAIITIVLLVTIVLGLSGYIIHDKFIAKEEAKPCQKCNNNTKELDDASANPTVIKNTDQTQYFISADRKYTLILNKPIQYTNFKIQNFSLIVDQTQSYDIISGDYEISDNQIILNSIIGCRDYNNNFNCSFPTDTKMINENGIIRFILAYDQVKIKLGNIELIKE